MPRFDGWAAVSIHGDQVLIDLADVPILMAHPWGVFRTKGRTYVTRSGAGDGEPQTVYLHRVLLGLTKGDGLECDHVNGNGLDNRRSNMRIVTHAQNLQNQRKQDGRTSKYRGVYFWKLRGVWAAKVKLNGKTYSLGNYRDEDEAGRVVAAWRARHMPFSADALKESA